jgi:hypothetical protein
MVDEHITNRRDDPDRTGDFLSTGALANPCVERKTFEVFYDEKQIDKLSKV